jgi:N-acetylneuraminic acid mutarotase
MAAVALDDNHVLAAGGYQEDFSADAFVFNLEARTVRRTAELPYAGMAALARIGETVYCVAGEDAMKHRTDRVFCISVRELMQE